MRVPRSPVARPVMASEQPSESDLLMAAATMQDLGRLVPESDEPSTADRLRGNIAEMDRKNVEGPDKPELDEGEARDLLGSLRHLEQRRIDGSWMAQRALRMIDQMRGKPEREFEVPRSALEKDL